MRTIQGFGINTDELMPSVDAQIAFIKKYLRAEYEELQEEVENSEDDMSNTSTYIDFCNRWIQKYEDSQGQSGFWGLFALAIQENEDGFYPECFQNGNGIVVYEDRMPWEMSDRVKEMDEDDMTAIYKKYLDDLGVSAEIGRQSLATF